MSMMHFGFLTTGMCRKKMPTQTSQQKGKLTATAMHWNVRYNNFNSVQYNIFHKKTKS